MNQTPSEVIEQARLASDPMVHLGTLRVREALRRWLEAGPGRVAQLSMRRDAFGQGPFWLAELFDEHTCRGSSLRESADDALAHAVSIAGAA
jgi:hypothetical protein